MNPKYRHYVNDTQVYPHYKSDMAKEYTLESGQRFFRESLSGKITLTGADFDLVNDAAFDTEFIYRIAYQRRDGSWDETYFVGKFMKTDCKFNLDDKAVEVKVDTNDGYNEVVGALEKEYDLIPLKPPMITLAIRKRALLQVYMLGDNVISSFLGNTYWEQSCNEVTNVGELESKYAFAQHLTDGVITVVDSSAENMGGTYRGTTGTLWTRTDGLYRVTREDYIPGIPFIYKLVRVSDGRQMDYVLSIGVWGSGTKTMVGGTKITWVSGAAQFFIRYLLDRDGIDAASTTSGTGDTKRLPLDDIVSDANPNYRWAIGVLQNSADNMVMQSGRTTPTPTEYGLAPNGEYWQNPIPASAGYEVYPIARSKWTQNSYWFRFPFGDWILEPTYTSPSYLNDCYQLSDVLKTLLAQFAPNVRFEPTAEYSEFLYGDAMGRGAERRNLIITQKSNVLNANHTRPASKAPILLRDVFNMLSGCYRCFWHIDDENKLHIEHVSWYMNGGRYGGFPELGTDITTLKVPALDKPWSYGVNSWEYDKVELAERIQFKYMDDVTAAFAGMPIETISKYVQAGKVDDVNISKFTPDVDFMLGAPSEFNKDGFALFEATHDNILIKYVIGTPWAAGYIDTDGVPKSSTGYEYYRSECIPSATYKLQRSDGQQINGVWWHFYDNRNRSIGRAAGVSGFATDGLITVPDNCYKLGVTVKTSAAATPTSTLPVNNVNDIAAIMSQGWVVPIITMGDAMDGVRLQNGLLSWRILHPTYHTYDLSGRHVRINGVDWWSVQGVQRMRKQQVNFPAETDPDPIKLIKTELGNGQPEKLSVNLSSRQVDATLKYDTE